jgi:hypothetical protein
MVKKSSEKPISISQVISPSQLVTPPFDKSRVPVKILFSLSK